MQLLANAKINWCLDITGTRADGYHLMDMLMQPISLHDVITLQPHGEIALTVSGTPYIPPDAHHLAYRAAAALQQAASVQAGAAIHVEKHIPSGAGLGGGSADAAAVLLGLNRLWELEWPLAHLMEIGLQLGADVPFCLHGGLCRVQGVGEIIQPLNASPAWELVIVQPCPGLSTGEIFRRWDAGTAVHPDTALLTQALLTAGHGLPGRPGNTLTAVSSALRPEIEAAIEMLLSCGAAAAEMSGSGSAVFGAFKQADTADTAAQMLSARWPKVFRCITCHEPVVFAD